VNGPAATVVSGDLDALAELAAECAVAGVRTRAVPVDYASHCAQVDAIREQVLDALAPVAPRPGTVPMVSALTGQWLAGPETGAGYWYESLRSAVEFDRAVRVLAGSGHRVFIEVSPHPVLTAAISAALDDALDPAAAGTCVVTGTLRRDDGGPARFIQALAEIHVRGSHVDWTAVLPPAPPQDLPTYPFQHHHYWPQRPLLGAAVPLAAGDGLLLTGRLSVRSHPWLADHVWPTSSWCLARRSWSLPCGPLTPPAAGRSRS
jgi:acyl transferase domain-containing protein